MEDVENQFVHGAGGVVVSLRRAGREEAGLCISPHGVLGEKRWTKFTRHIPRVSYSAKVLGVKPGLCIR